MNQTWAEWKAECLKLADAYSRDVADNAMDDYGYAAWPHDPEESRAALERHLDNHPMVGLLTRLSTLPEAECIAEAERLRLESVASYERHLKEQT